MVSYPLSSTHTPGTPAQVVGLSVAFSPVVSPLLPGCSSCNPVLVMLSSWLTPQDPDLYGVDRWDFNPDASSMFDNNMFDTPPPPFTGRE
jgi:hypothetical protein